MGKYSKLSVFFGLLFVLLFIAGSANAQVINRYKSNSAGASKSANTKDFAVTKENLRATGVAMKKSKLSEARLRVCAQRSEKISMRFKNLLSFGVKSHEKMNTVVIRVDNFYNKMLVPHGHTLSNYAELKADIDVKKTKVQEALVKAQTSGQGFSCDSEDPKAQADTFRQDIQSLMAANKEYKSSVRAFVVAVRDLAKQAKADTLSPAASETTSATPEASTVLVE